MTIDNILKDVMHCLDSILSVEDADEGESSLDDIDWCLVEETRDKINDCLQNMALETFYTERRKQ